MGRVRHYAVQATVLLALLGVSLTLPGIMRSNKTSEDFASYTPTTVDSSIVTEIGDASTTPESSITPLPTYTPVPSATQQASSKPVPTRAFSPIPTETLNPTMEPSIEPTTLPSAEPTLEPTSTPSGIFLEVVSLTSPVTKDNYASLTALTYPDASCQITVYYKSGASKAKGLEAKNADDSGNVSWTWKVGSATTSGNWRIVVKASKEGQEVTKEVYFTVQ